MNIVRIHGRNKKYNFDLDDKLKTIKKGEFGDKMLGDKNKNILALDSFMTIWLITLPKKFNEWWQYYKLEEKTNNGPNKILLYDEVPTFPLIAPKTQTSLQKNSVSDCFDFLPNSWNLMECYSYFFWQMELWTTNSIDQEYLNAKKTIDEAF